MKTKRHVLLAIGLFCSLVLYLEIPGSVIHSRTRVSDRCCSGEV